ncbi:MAG: M56 family metallopeptidase [Chitinophagales bacterium]
MNSLLYYLLQVIVASGILYSYYHFALRNKKFHRYNRFYLLSATIISILIPFLNIPVYFTHDETNSSFVLQTLTVISTSHLEETTVAPYITASIKHNWFTWENISYAFYLLIATLTLLRVFFSLRKIRTIVKNNPVEKLDNIHFINTDEPGTPFSFFRWLFWNRKIELKSEKGEQVFRHELFHIEQKHSLDIVFMELLTVIFWINPFFHLIKKEIKAIHEFLADEFATNENEKWGYAELLLMQAFNTQIHLANPFFHNQIKRRIAMITLSKKPKYQYLRKLLVFPVAAIVFTLFAFQYREKAELDKFKPVDMPITDTMEKPFTKKEIFFSKPDNLILEADTLIWKKSPHKTKTNFQQGLIILNGEKIKNDILSEKTIVSG